MMARQLYTEVAFLFLNLSALMAGSTSRPVQLYLDSKYKVTHNFPLKKTVSISSARLALSTARSCKTSPKALLRL